MSSAVQLLPTTTAMDSEASGGSSPINVTLTDAVVRTELGTVENPRHLLRTPAAAEAGGGPRDRNRPGATMRLSDQIREEIEDGNISLLPTPSVSNSHGNDRNGRGELLLPGIAMQLLPTPVAQPSGNSPEEHLRKKPGRTQVTDLAIMAENGLIETGGKLLPTPEAKLATSGPDYARMGREGSGGDDLTTALWKQNMHLLPTPNVAMAEGGQTSRSGDRKGEPLLGGIAVEQATDWGPYTAAIRRWEQIIGRPAPSPVRNDGKGGKPRLNPELTEWMMGWPHGWVTASVIGLTRSEQLKACGNGVVTLQAIWALRILLARPGVPKPDYGLGLAA